MDDKTIHELHTDEAKANVAYAEAAVEVARLELKLDALEQSVRAAKAAKALAYDAQCAVSDALTEHYRRESEARKATVKP